MENERLRQAKGDFEKERDMLMNQIKVKEVEERRATLENKELKKKIKKLERIVYGKK